MKLEYIREFLVLAEKLNFSVAANLLFISQPTLTRHIQTMEGELGFKLLHTTSHGVSLTEYGEAAVKPFRKVMKDYQAFLEQSKTISKQVRGSLTVGLLYYAIDEHFADFLTHFQREYPNVELICKSYLPQTLYDDLNAGVVDAAALFALEDGLGDSIRFVRTAGSSLVAVMRADDPLATQEMVSLEELANRPLVLLKDDAYSNEITQSILRRNGIRFNKNAWADTMEMVPLTVRTTGGVHITGESCKRQRAPGVVYQPIRMNRSPLALGFACLADSRNEMAELLLKAAQNYFGI